MSAAGNSVTLHDVLEVCEAKKAPLAPELAGYLILGIAEAISPAAGDLDPRGVVIHDEGGLAVMQGAGGGGDTESSLRALLGRMLAISGAQNQGLAAVARGAPKASLGALVEELEAALIPVNRSAGRRALARLSREIARVRASVPQNKVAPAAAAPKPPPQRQGPPGAPPLQPIARPRAASTFDDESITNQRGPQTRLGVAPPQAPPSPPGKSALLTALPRITPEEDVPTHRQDGPPSHEQPVPTPRAPDSTLDGELPTRVLEAKDVPPLAIPPAGGKTAPPHPGPSATAKSPSASGTPVLDAMAGKLFGSNEVDSLLSTFESPSVLEGGQAQRDLKAMAGLSPTPPPLDATQAIPGRAKSSAAPALPGGVAAASGIDALLALSEPPARRLPDDDTATAMVEVRGRNPFANIAAGPVGGVTDPAFDKTLEAGEETVVPMPRDPGVPRFPSAPSYGQGAAGQSQIGGVASAMPAHLSSSSHGQSQSGSGRRTAYAATEMRGEGSSSGSRVRGASLGPPAETQIAPKESSFALRFGIVLGLLAAVAGGGVFLVRSHPEILSSRAAKFFGIGGPATDSSSSTTSGSKCRSSIYVSSVPLDAEVLLKVGNAPCEVPRMPKGPRLEFVATADGFVPRRAVIAKDDTGWQLDPQGHLRYELPVTLDISKGGSDPWPMGEPGSEVGGSGEPGTVRVVAKPKNAIIWLLAGVGPAAQIEQRCDQDVDILVAGRVREVLHVTRKQIESVPPDPSGVRIVRLTAGANGATPAPSTSNTGSPAVPAPTGAPTGGNKEH